MQFCHVPFILSNKKNLRNEKLLTFCQELDIHFVDFLLYSQPIGDRLENLVFFRLIVDFMIQAIPNL